jgi:hypothetical protein
VKRAGRAVEFRPAPEARNAAHPQERQHSAAEGSRPWLATLISFRPMRAPF